MRTAIIPLHTPCRRDIEAISCAPGRASWAVVRNTNVREHIEYTHTRKTPSDTLDIKD
ncbi:uncharacterized protein PHALS_06393 [Plasmopara halstedii]|uniref:Uncharacterized protein n=1 Tax=Plasmopara halstedii TaxID=4781 RepID=A0A0P1B3D9_PLAHL|nr:uncharacterized protein PHALS_06393 [Plasmopara halstedii]CEG48577.1 hypothetical protein PHALS_06393 [Plasmopara halstedii]|eukprot:XP_024584946.1 hypothetical protein PHALS_06393 [Plasmopara halstedii]